MEGDPLPNNTTGAASRKQNGELSAFRGVGPSRSYKISERAHTCQAWSQARRKRGITRSAKQCYLTVRSFMVGIDLVQPRSQRAPKDMGEPHAPPRIKAFIGYRELQVWRDWQHELVKHAIAVESSELIGQISSTLHSAMKKEKGQLDSALGW